MRSQVKKWDNSASVRIPGSIMSAAALKLDLEVDVREEDGRIIIEPVAVPANELDELLGRMSEDTFHDDIDFGPAVGREAW